MRPEAYLRLMSALLALLLVANLAAIYVDSRTDGGLPGRLATLFLFDAEANFATFFNFALIVGNAALLALAALVAFDARDRWRWHWLILGLLFLLLAYDEAARLHERLVPIGRALFPAEGVFFFGWVVFGAGFVLVVGLAYLRFLFALPAPIAVLVATGGGLYVAGALGVEMLGGRFASQHGQQNVGFHLIATVEETLEMAGQIVFGFALLRHLSLARAPRRG